VKGTLIVLVFFFVSLLHAQDAGTNVKLPISIGIFHESRSNLQDYEDKINITPFLGIILPGIGGFKVGYVSLNTQEVSPTDTLPLEINKYWTQLSFPLGFSPQSPYFIVSYTKNQWLRNDVIGDVVWSEWGLGLGGMWLVHPMMGLFAEGEYRWVESHRVPNLNRDTKNKTNTLQMNVGLFVYFY
jgi:hypothetical protein